MNTNPAPPLQFIARQLAGQYKYAYAIGGACKEGESIKSEQAFDQTSSFIVKRITCVSNENKCIIRIEEGNEVLHTIAEGDEYSTDVKDIWIKRLDALRVHIIKSEKNENPIIVRLEGDLYPAWIVSP